MANERIPNDRISNDPYRASDPHPADAPYRTKPRSNYVEDDISSGAPLESATRFDSDLQMDPELTEGPASSGKIALFAIGVALILGAVFYGLNSSSINQASTAPAATTAQNAAPASPPSTPPGMRDVTPRANDQPGITTGAAPATPKSADPK